MRARGPLADLIVLLGRLPGVGERSATRLAFHVLSADVSFAQALGDSLKEIHERVQRCHSCGNFDEETPCYVCRDTTRNPRLLCVVARVQDLVALERSASFRGVYHVLHGLLSPLDGRGPDALSMDTLEARVRNDGVDEVVVATPLSVEGEATALYVAQILRATNAKVSRIASGIPHGGELEFADQITLGRAFEGRRAL